MMFFSKNMMFLDNEFNNSDELFDFVYKKALENGLVREGFCEAIKEREKNYPTGLPGTAVDIAVPHTDPEYVIEPFIAVLRCQKGVPFVQMGSDDMIIHPKLFFVLGFKKEGCIQYQVKALQLLIEYFIVTDNGRLANEFMQDGPEQCMEKLFELEKTLLGQDEKGGS